MLMFKVKTTAAPKRTHRVFSHFLKHNDAQDYWKNTLWTKVEVFPEFMSFRSSIKLTTATK